MTVWKRQECLGKFKTGIFDLSDKRRSRRLNILAIGLLKTYLEADTRKCNKVYKQRKILFNDTRTSQRK